MGQGRRPTRHKWNRYVVSNTRLVHGGGGGLLCAYRPLVVAPHADLQCGGLPHVGPHSPNRGYAGQPPRATRISKAKPRQIRGPSLSGWLILYTGGRGVLRVGGWLGPNPREADLTTPPPAANHQGIVPTPPPPGGILKQRPAHPRSHLLRGRGGGTARAHPSHRQGPASTGASCHPETAHASAQTSGT